METRGPAHGPEEAAGPHPLSLWRQKAPPHSQSDTKHRPHGYAWTPRPRPLSPWRHQAPPPNSRRRQPRPLSPWGQLAPPPVAMGTRDSSPWSPWALPSLLYSPVPMEMPGMRCELSSAMLALPSLPSDTSQCWIPEPLTRTPEARPTADRHTAFAPVPARAGLAREVIKWLQSLDLRFPFKNIKTAFCNGYLVAEIFAWYYPQDIDVKIFNNGVSFPSKLKNWSQLEHFFFRKKLNIPKELIYATMHSKPGGAEYLIQHIYTLLTNRQAKLILDDEMNFMDEGYQLKLPLIARATATNAIRTNLRLTELLEDPDIYTVNQKALAIINMHVRHRQLARLEHPKRYNLKPTLGERATRLPLPQYQYECLYPDSKKTDTAELKSTTSEIRSKSNVHFKEINVKQVVRDSHSLSANHHRCSIGQ